MLGWEWDRPNKLVPYPLSIARAMHVCPYNADFAGLGVVLREVLMFTELFG